MTKSFIVHEADVEAVPLPGGGSFRLLEDSENSGGLFGANRLTLAAGADGLRTQSAANPADGTANASVRR